MDEQSRQLLKEQLKFINLLLKHRQVSKLLSSFLEPFDTFIQSDGRIRPHFHNTVCVTGRLSCSAPNVEQLPKDNEIAPVRNLFICDRDNIFIVADYSGQELRILGEETQDPTLVKALIAGLDLHQLNADEFGLSRNEAKSISFGVAYGKQAYGFAKDFGCSQVEAQQFLDKFFNKFPVVRTRIEKCREQVYRKGYVVNKSGRRRRFPDFHKGSKWQKERCYRQAFNFLIQSYAADMIKVAAAKVIQDTNLKLVNIIHDELVVECNKNYIEQGKQWIEKCMINAVKMCIPLELDFGTGERYGEAK